MTTTPRPLPGLRLPTAMSIARSWLSRLLDTVRPRSPNAGAAGPFRRLRSPWDWERLILETDSPCFCNVCGWCGDAFLGGAHSEAALCEDCGSIARDRFLLLCFVGRTPPGRYRVLETSPRLGADYRQAMGRWLDYRASDFDQRSHRAALKLDLQRIDLDDASLDVLLTPHVLEHVPDTDRALAEIHRVLAPSGRMYLQVPVLQGETARPQEPEFHGDDTPVEWRFGPDLTTRLRRHGFRTRLLCTRKLYELVFAGADRWPGPTSPEFDVASILAALDLADLEPVAEPEVSRRLGLEPGYMFLTWEAVRVEE